MLFLFRFFLFRQSLFSVVVCISKYRPESGKVFGRNTLAAEQEEDTTLKTKFFWNFFEKD